MLLLMQIVVIFGLVVCPVLAVVYAAKALSLLIDCGDRDGARTGRRMEVSIVIHGLAPPTPSAAPPEDLLPAQSAPPPRDRKMKPGNSHHPRREPGR